MVAIVIIKIVKEEGIVSVEMLKIIAMGTMFIDHIGYLGVVGDASIYFRCIGRIAFPIYAYLIASNFTKTRNKGRYVKSLGLFAILSEIPFNLLQGKLIDNSSKNVLFTFFLASLVLYYLDKSSSKKNSNGWIAVFILSLFFADSINSNYSKWGVMFIVLIYMSESAFEIESLKEVIREEEGEEVIEPVWSLNLDYIEKSIALVVSIFFATMTLCRFTTSESVSVFGFTFPCQMFGLLSIFPIGLYNLSGQVKVLEGERDRLFRKICYWFYPVHMLVLAMFFT